MLIFFPAVKSTSNTSKACVEYFLITFQHEATLILTANLHYHFLRCTRQNSILFIFLKPKTNVLNIWPFKSNTLKNMRVLSPVWHCFVSKDDNQTV